MILSNKVVQHQDKQLQKKRGRPKGSKNKCSGTDLNWLLAIRYVKLILNITIGAAYKRKRPTVESDVEGNNRTNIFQTPSSKPIARRPSVLQCPTSDEEEEPHPTAATATGILWICWLIFHIFQYVLSNIILYYLEDKPHPNKRGRPKGPLLSARKNSSEETKLPGDITFPLTSFSLTVTKNKGDISDQLLPIIADFVNEFCTRGS